MMNMIDEQRRQLLLLMLHKKKYGSLQRFGVEWCAILFLSLCLCSNRCVAQIIYDSPPVGVSLTRPVLPWLARYFVGAGDRALFFLDEPQRGPGGPMAGAGAGGPPASAAGRMGGGGQPPSAAIQGPGRASGAAAEAPAASPSAPAQPNGLPPLTEQQKAQLRQLQYMAPVPVPVLSAPVLPQQTFLPPQPPPPPLLRQHFAIARPAFVSPGALHPISAANPRPPPPESLPLQNSPSLAPSPPSPAAPPVADMPSSPALAPPTLSAVPAYADFALPESLPPAPFAMPFIAPAPAPIAVPPRPALSTVVLPFAYEPMPVDALPPLVNNWAVPMQNNVLTNGSLQPKSAKLFFRDVILGGAMPPPPVRGGSGSATPVNRMSKFNG